MHQQIFFKFVMSSASTNLADDLYHRSKSYDIKNNNDITTPFYADNDLNNYTQYDLNKILSNNNPTIKGNNQAQITVTSFAPDKSLTCNNNNNKSANPQQQRPNTVFVGDSNSHSGNSNGSQDQANNDPNKLNENNAKLLDFSFFLSYIQHIIYRLYGLFFNYYISFYSLLLAHEVSV